MANIKKIIFLQLLIVVCVYSSKNPTTFVLKSTNQSYELILSNSHLSYASRWYHDAERVETIDGLKFGPNHDLIITASPRSMNFWYMDGDFEINDTVNKTTNYNLHFYVPFYFGSPEYTFTNGNKYKDVKCTLNKINVNLHHILCQ